MLCKSRSLSVEKNPVSLLMSTLTRAGGPSQYCIMIMKYTKPTISAFLKASHDVEFHETHYHYLFHGKASHQDCLFETFV